MDTLEFFWNKSNEYLIPKNIFLAMCHACNMASYMIVGYEHAHHAF
jgi:hypothetical protein